MCHQNEPRCWQDLKREFAVKTETPDARYWYRIRVFNFYDPNTREEFELTLWNHMA